MLDPITFEILRHRFMTIVREGAITLRNVSGSPTVALSNDCNVALLNETGEAVIVGPTIVSHALGCMYAAKYIHQNYAENPGLSEGDLFLSNDPYICTPHQTCTVVVGPVYWQGQSVGWTGAGIHIADAGGPTPGQVSLGAQSIWEEATPLPPVKIVEGGVVRKDIEQDYLKRSRTPAQNAIDLRAKISANTIMQRRFSETIERYGLDTVKEAMQRIMDTTESKLRALLSEIPNGSWSEVAYLDYFDREKLQVYVCRMTMTKERDVLNFDFSGSSEQAPGVINVTRPALEGYVVRAVMTIFGFAISPCPGGVFRVCRFHADPGTFVNCSWPAGVCKGTTSGTYAVLRAVTSCISQMLSRGQMDRWATTGLRGHMPLLDFSGTDQYGQRFAGVFTDCSLGMGGGARGTQDGIDTGSGSEPEVAIPNVETNELRYPILYLYRRQARDSAGAGKFRGGLGIDVAFKPHGVPSIPHLILHSHGVACPSTVGLAGGYPAACNEMVIIRGCKAASLFQQGILPQDLKVLGGHREELESFGRNWLNEDDLFHCTGAGGGGWGDPLERDPVAVVRDVNEGLVTTQWAKEPYGVICVPSGELDVEGTRQMRDRMRQQRLSNRGRRSEAKTSSSYPAFVGPVADIERDLFKGDHGQCSGCGAQLSGDDFVSIPWSTVAPYCQTLINNGLFELAGWFCKKCQRLERVKYYPRTSDNS